MFIPPAYLVSSAYVLTVKTVSKSDQLMLKHLSDAISKLGQGVKDGGISNKKFARLYPVGDVPKWQALRSKVAPSSEAYTNLTLLLCFHHVDYAKNIHNLLGRYRAWHRSGEMLNNNLKLTKQELADAGSTVNVEEISAYLEILYRKHHDSLSLDSMLSLRLDGAGAEEQSAAIVELWGDNPLPLLISAYQSAVRTRNIVDALDTEGKEARPKFYRELKRLAHNPDPRVAATAKKVDHDLRKSQPD